MNPLRSLQESGQAVWLDYIRRDMLIDGELERMVREDGVSGVTSNPAIFGKAIGDSTVYDEEISALVRENPKISIDELYERLVIDDIRAAADILAPVYESTNGADGFVSLEVSPHLARDTEHTVAEATRLWDAVGRQNLMIKVPATAEGVPAIERLLHQGIHVNVTLMFSLAHYDAVAEAYLRALEGRENPSGVASVASFFVSRVDSRLDQELRAVDSAVASRLLGRIAIANSKITYQRYLALFESPRFAALRERGARVQRVLWASTSTKEPSYSDVLYVEELVGPDTVNTIPPETLDAFRDHGRVRQTLTEAIDEAREELQSLADLGLDLDYATTELQAEGVEKFVVPFDRLLATLRKKRDGLVGAASR